MKTNAYAIDVDCVPRLGHGFRLQWESVQDAYVLLYPEGMVQLNRSAGEILARCGSGRNVGGIVAELEHVFGQADLERDVIAFLELAHAQRWVEFE